MTGVSPTKLSYCCLFERYDARKSIEIPEIPKYASVSNNIAWFKVSKAFDMSKNSNGHGITKYDPASKFEINTCVCMLLASVRRDRQFHEKCNPINSPIKICV